MDSGSHPKLARGCKLRTREDGDYLLMPESMLRMNRTGCEILKRCDGAHTVEQIVAELQTVYAGVDARARRGPRFTPPSQLRACRGPHWRSSRS